MLCYIGASRGKREGDRTGGAERAPRHWDPGERRRATAMGTSVGSNPGLAPMVAMGEETSFVGGAAESVSFSGGSNVLGEHVNASLPAKEMSTFGLRLSKSVRRSPGRWHHVVCLSRRGPVDRRSRASAPRGGWQLQPR